MLKCDDCGDENETVVDTICPFAAEIHETEVEITVCEDCYTDRLYDI